MPSNVQAVVTGSKGFVDAVGAQLRLRCAGAVVSAASGADALRSACGPERGLLVLEHLGPECLEALRAVRAERDRGALAIVAAVPPARAGDTELLRRAGADEVVCWDARIEPVAWAVDRVLASRAAAVRAAAPTSFAIRELADGAPSPARAQAPRLPRGAGIAPAASHGAAAAAVALAPAPPVGRATAVVAEQPGDEELTTLLSDAIEGVLPAAPALRQLTERVAAALSAPERAALSGQELPCDAAPLRTAALLRWRVEAVLERARAGDGTLDPTAAALPAALDGVLQSLTELGEKLPPEALAAVAGVRNALVREAIHLTDALARTAAPVVAAVPAPAPAQPAATRVLSNDREQLERERPRARGGLAVLLALAVLAAAGYHAHAWARRPTPPPPRRMGGAPDGLVVRGSPAGRVKLLVSEPGRPVDAAQLERFRKEQELQGLAVRQVAPHVVVVESPDPAQPPPAPEQARP